MIVSFSKKSTVSIKFQQSSTRTRINQLQSGNAVPS